MSSLGDAVLRARPGEADEENPEKVHVNNTQVVTMWKESRKDPLDFFLSWDEEVSRRLPLWMKQNEDVLRSVNLFSYARMMDTIRGVDTVLSIEMDLEDPDSLRVVYRNHTAHLEELDAARKIGFQEVTAPVRSLLVQLFLGMRHGKKKAAVDRRYRLLFVSFLDHPRLARELPVLPMEWISGKDALLATVLHKVPEATLVQEMRAGWGMIARVFQSQFSMECTLNTKTVCMRHPESRTALGKKIFSEKEYPKKWLVKLAHRCGMPDASLSTPREEICGALERVQPTAVALELVQRYFRPMLMESVQASPRYMMVLKGGYNLKILLREQFHEKSMIFTSDLDFAVSPSRENPGEWTMEKIIDLWDKEMRAFIDLNEYTRAHFYYKPTLLPPSPESPMRAILQLKFEGTDFVDISFTTEVIEPGRINRRIAKKVGLPVTRFTWAFLDLIKMIVMENIPGMNDRAFDLRNPVTGKRPEKGIRDLYRARVACEALCRHPRVPVAQRDLLSKICAYRKRFRVDSQKKLAFLESIHELLEKN
jgi:hypothetical protein